MPQFTDQHYLVSDQYHGSSNLDARIQLHQRFSTNKYGWFRWVFDQFDFSPNACILEIGCGTGLLWQDNQARIPSTWRILLSDLSREMLRDCQRNLDGLHLHLSYSAINAMLLPLPTGSIDAVIANHMLYHIPERNCALSEIARVLKPGGYFFAATNGVDHLRELTDIVNQCFASEGISFIPSFSVDEFDLENGIPQLSPWFENIELRQYPDSLVITNAAALVRYIQSMIPRSSNETSSQDNSDLQGWIDNLIKKQGSIFIHKNTGMFICRKRTA